MKFLSLLTLFCIAAGITFSQSPKITWGEEFKLRKGSTDLSVISSDNSGVYLQESHRVLKGYFVIGYSTRESATLIKLDKNFTEIYHNDFNKELRGKDFEDFAAVEDKIYILASDYERSTKTLTLYAAEVNGMDGELKGDWQPLASWNKEQRKDAIHFRLASNANNSTLILVSSIEGQAQNNYQVQEFDKSLKSIGKAISISNEFDPKTFQLEDVIYTIEKKVVLVGRIYEYEEGRRKANRFLNFSHYNVRIYDNTGRQQSDIKTDINAKWLVSTKVIQEADKDLVLAAFYSNEKRGREINGLLVQRINPANGDIITTSQKELNTSLITAVDTDDNTEGETREERKEREKFDKIKDEGEGFNRYMKFRNIFYTPDNGLVILAEKYYHYTYTTTTYTSGANGIGSSSTQTYSVFESGDLMMCKINAGGDITWLNVLPKSQSEVVSGDYSGGTSNVFSVGTYYFNTANLPFYSGFGALQNGNTINLFFNDNPKNEGVVQLGQRVRRANRFGKSNCFSVQLDGSTGKFTRKMFFSNNDVPTAMPRLGATINGDMYIVGKEDRFFGKTKIAVAKITVGR